MSCCILNSSGFYRKSTYLENNGSFLTLDLSYVGGGLIVLNTMFGASILCLPYIVKISGGILPYLILLTCVAIGNAISMAVLGMYGT